MPGLLRQEEQPSNCVLVESHKVLGSREITGQLREQQIEGREVLSICLVIFLISIES